MEYTLKNAGVYCILNINNNKRYIGSTININRRWKEHKRDLNNNCHHSKHLQKSWDKHGEENFKFIIIEISQDINSLIIREQYWINFYESFDKNKGYNVSPTAGSNLGFKMSEETKQKMSDSKSGEKHHMYGKTHSVLTKQLISKAHIGMKYSEETKLKLSELRVGEKHPLYGTHRSEQTKEKIRQSNKKYYLNHNGFMYGKKHTKETKDKIKFNRPDFSNEHNPFYGKTHSQEAKKKMSLIRKTLYSGENHPMYGKTHSIETKDKIRKSREGKYFGENSPRAKVNNSIVREIRRLYEKDNKTIKNIMDLLNLSRDIVDKIVKYKTWKNVK